MLFKIVITPDVFTLSNVESLERDLDFLWDYVHENCILFLPNGNEWTEHILKFKSSQFIHDKTTRYLNRMKDENRIVTSGIPVKDENWIEWALTIYKEYELYAIIMPKNKRIALRLHGNRYIDFPLNPTQPAVAELKNAKFCSIITDEINLEVNLKPILEYARVLRVIDPYLNTKPWSENSIRIASKLLSGSLQNNKYSGLFEIYLSAKKSQIRREELSDPRRTLNIWQPMLDKFYKEYGVRFQVTIFGNYENQKGLHDRYILTDQCGVELSTGFSCDKPVHPQTWKLLPKTSFSKITNMFVFNPPYPIKAQFKYPSY